MHMTPLDPYLSFGIVGMTLILVAFILNQLKRLSQETLIYDLMNAIGGLLLVLYAFDARAWPFVILNGVWTLYSARDVILHLQKKT